MTLKIKVAVIAVLVGIFFWPIPYTASPSWEVWVVDEVGKPIEGMKVRLSYQNFSAESKGHELEPSLTLKVMLTLQLEWPLHQSHAMRCIQCGQRRQVYMPVSVGTPTFSHSVKVETEAQQWVM